MTDATHDSGWRARRWSLRVGGAAAVVMMSASAAWACTVSGGSAASTLSGGYTFPTDGNPSTPIVSPQNVSVTAWHPGGAKLQPPASGTNYHLHFASAADLASDPACHHGRHTVEGEQRTTTPHSYDGTGEITFGNRLTDTFVIALADEGTGQICFARDPSVVVDADVGNAGEFTITVPDE